MKNKLIVCVGEKILLFRKMPKWNFRYSQSQLTLRQSLQVSSASQLMETVYIYCLKSGFNCKVFFYSIQPSFLGENILKFLLIILASVRYHNSILHCISHWTELWFCWGLLPVKGELFSPLSLCAHWVEASPTNSTAQWILSLDKKK